MPYSEVHKSVGTNYVAVGTTEKLNRGINPDVAVHYDSAVQTYLQWRGWPIPAAAQRNTDGSGK